MVTILPVLNAENKVPYYMQIYAYIKEEILKGSIRPGERLPSLRNLAKDLGLSITTIELAYSQLVVEGYIESKANSGYYINEIRRTKEDISKKFEGEGNSFHNIKERSTVQAGFDQESKHGFDLLYDLSSFDFYKWKKCMNKILTDYSPMLLTEGDAQGERSLRFQISRYVFQSRGVRCDAEQVVVGAGTQQINGVLCLILNMMGIKDAIVEDPGYLPVRKILSDRGLAISPVAVSKDGIQIENFPQMKNTIVYTSPSNQFPMGSVMPVGRRYKLLEWANESSSIIVEDDYDSELRYFGRTIPSLQSLDKNEKVVYLGSFSSTLFPSIKISYMILPRPMLKLFQEINAHYTQTCSKTEQLTLALYMEQGMFQTHIKKLRKQYAQKLLKTQTAIEAHMSGHVETVNTQSGLHMIIKINTNKAASEIIASAASVGIDVVPVGMFTNQEEANNRIFLLYYTKMPLGSIDAVLKKLSALWFDEYNV